MGTHRYTVTPARLRTDVTGWSNVSFLETGPIDCVGPVSVLSSNTGPYDRACNAL